MERRRSLIRDVWEFLNVVAEFLEIRESADCALSEPCSSAGLVWPGPLPLRVPPLPSYDPLPFFSIEFPRTFVLADSQSVSLHSAWAMGAVLSCGFTGVTTALAISGLSI